jgi:hypothetical protein
LKYQRGETKKEQVKVKSFFKHAIILRTVVSVLYYQTRKSYALSVLSPHMHNIMYTKYCTAGRREVFGNRDRYFTVATDSQLWKEHDSTQTRLFNTQTQQQDLLASHCRDSPTAPLYMYLCFVVESAAER